MISCEYIKLDSKTLKWNRLHWISNMLNNFLPLCETTETQPKLRKIVLYCGFRDFASWPAGSTGIWVCGQAKRHEGHDLEQSLSPPFVLQLNMRGDSLGSTNGAMIPASSSRPHLEWIYFSLLSLISWRFYSFPNVL